MAVKPVGKYVSHMANGHTLTSNVYRSDLVKSQDFKDHVHKNHQIIALMRGEIIESFEYQSA